MITQKFSAVKTSKDTLVEKNTTPCHGQTSLRLSSRTQPCRNNITEKNFGQKLSNICLTFEGKWLTGSPFLASNHLNFFLRSINTILPKVGYQQSQQITAIITSALFSIKLQKKKTSKNTKSQRAQCKQMCEVAEKSLNVCEVRT